MVTVTSKGSVQAWRPKEATVETSITSGQKGFSMRLKVEPTHGSESVLTPTLPLKHSQELYRIKQTFGAIFHFNVC